MLEQQITKLTSTEILPPAARKRWRDKEVVVSVYDDEIIIRQTDKPLRTWEEMRKLMKEVGKEVTPEDLEEAIAQARKQLYDKSGS